jgi:hypothetical protein
MRILFEVEKNGATINQVVISSSPLPPGGIRVIGPPELSYVVAAMNRRVADPVTMLGAPTQAELGSYEGKSVLVSLDSASTVTGQFLGPDKLNYFTTLVQGDLDKRIFFDDILKLTGTASDQVKDWLIARRAAARARVHGHGLGFRGLDLAAMDEGSDCTHALALLNNGGVVGLMSWAEQQKNLLNSTETLHR